MNTTPAIYDQSGRGNHMYLPSDLPTGGGDDEDNAPSAPDLNHTSEAAGEFLHDGSAINPFRALVTEVLNLHPNPLHVEQRGGIRVYLTNPRRNAERKLVKAHHGFRQVKKARQVARYILREQAARTE